MGKRSFLGSAAGLLIVGGAQAADLPTRKAAPVNYVRICDAYGAGFFYMPGTDTCLKVGGLALFEARVFDTPYSIDDGFYSGSSPKILKTGLGPLGAAGEGRAPQITGTLAVGTITGSGPLDVSNSMHVQARATAHSAGFFAWIPRLDLARAAKPAH